MVTLPQTIMDVDVLGLLEYHCSSRNVGLSSSMLCFRECRTKNFWAAESEDQFDWLIDGSLHGYSSCLLFAQSNLVPWIFKSCANLGLIDWMR